jgi:hypothetical protein
MNTCVCMHKHPSTLYKNDLPPPRGYHIHTHTHTQPLPHACISPITSFYLKSSKHDTNESRPLDIGAGATFVSNACASRKSDISASITQACSSSSLPPAAGGKRGSCNSVFCWPTDVDSLLGEKRQNSRCSRSSSSSPSFPAGCYQISSYQGVLKPKEEFGAGLPAAVRKGDIRALSLAFCGVLLHGRGMSEHYSTYIKSKKALVGVTQHPVKEEHI